MKDHIDKREQVLDTSAFLIDAEIDLWFGDGSGIDSPEIKNAKRSILKIVEVAIYKL